MIVKLLTEHHLEFLSLKGGCRGSSESTLVKMSNCWKSHAAAHLSLQFLVKSVYWLLKIHIKLRLHQCRKDPYQKQHATILGGGGITFAIFNVSKGLSQQTFKPLRQASGSICSE